MSSDVTNPVRGQDEDASADVCDLRKWAYLYCWKDWLPRLAEKALPERWDFSPSDCDEDGSPRYAILDSYLRYTFWRLVHEEKVCENARDGFAAYNTGLVDRSYESIYACFEANDRPGMQPWKLIGFYCAGEERVGDRLVRTFNPLPQRARYLKRLEDVLYDDSQVPVLDYEHILLDNIDRLPQSFLERELYDSPKLIALVKRGFSAVDDPTAAESEGRAALDELKRKLPNDGVHWMRLKNALDVAVNLALERVKWSYRTAVPAYYPRANSVNLLLPLDLTEDAEPDMALVLERTASGSYIGQTILTPRMAYCDARLVCRPDVDWLDESFENGAS
ncbi:MAG: DUF3825 domain-containing protein [Tractidigestivibacter sp.]|jgi:hypothetical protein|uniref:DUF3825 domain-containing protein n=1 Tax=Tractidigestivibacter sp. TaxID=2847320 RepID=UPI003D8D56FA